NNLLRRNGRNPVFCGEKILIKGRVVDSNCVPVSDAKVYLWQVGCDGKYPYKPLRAGLNMAKFNLKKNASTFQGSGIATTNNNGEFVFITTYPVKSDSKSPYVNFRVSHRELGDLQTKFFPGQDSKNSDDDSSSYYVEIVLPAKNKHRSY
ncbi:MAG: intradiol ring-cleavage dioxygenase, partial [Rickettsiaceae bacterium]|nr:intradiol ring-cleavage dioxygenase [Rickettsiaceae bacterium]